MCINIMKSGRMANDDPNYGSHSDSDHPILLRINRENRGREGTHHDKVFADQDVSEITTLNPHRERNSAFPNLPLARLSLACDDLTPHREQQKRTALQLYPLLVKSFLNRPLLDSQRSEKRHRLS